MLAETRQRVVEYLSLLVRCEEAVEGFYRACAAQWPREAAFWQELADEETDSAVRLELLKSRIGATPHGVGLLHPFSPGALQAFVHGVDELTALVRSGGVDMSGALVQARELGQSGIGGQPLRGLSFDDPRFDRYRAAFSETIVGRTRRISDRMEEALPARTAAA